VNTDSGSARVFAARGKLYIAPFLPPLTFEVCRITVNATNGQPQWKFDLLHQLQVRLTAVSLTAAAYKQWVTAFLCHRLSLTGCCSGMSWQAGVGPWQRSQHCRCDKHDGHLTVLNRYTGWHQRSFESHHSQQFLHWTNEIILILHRKSWQNTFAAKPYFYLQTISMRKPSTLWSTKKPGH